MSKKTHQILQFITKYKQIQRILDDPFYSSPYVVRIFTNGSCTNNGYINAVGGFSAILVAGYCKNNLLFGKVNPTMLSTSITTSTNITAPTNIRAEGLAILTALNELNDTSDNDKWTEAVIYSDSMFWINMIKNQMPIWDRTIINTRPNPDITISIRDVWSNINKVKNVQIEHVYAHNKDNKADSRDTIGIYTFHNNDLANILANIAKDSPDYDIQRISINNV
jgi:ribonuclease HI